MSTVPPFLILTATRTASGIRKEQVVECLDHYYQKNDDNGTYVRSLFAGNKIGPKEVEPDPSRVNPKDFDSMPHVIKRLFDDSVAPNDAYSVNVPNGSEDNQIFNKPTEKKDHITFPSLPTEEKKLAAFVFAFILCSIVGTKTDETYTSFDFSANSATSPLNVYTSADTAYNIDAPDEAERIRSALKAMAIDFYAPTATRHSLYIFKQPVDSSPPFVTDVVDGSAYLFTIDLTKIDQSEFSLTGNLRVGLNADSGEPETVESLLGFNLDAGYILALITNQDVEDAPVA